MNELSNNVDGFRLSTYLHKDRDEKLMIGPIWDFNLSFGNANYCGGESTIFGYIDLMRDVWGIFGMFHSGGIDY